MAGSPVQAASRVSQVRWVVSVAVDRWGRLSVGAVDALDLVAEVGTPAYIYDELHLRRRCRAARAAFGAGVAYASKAFLCRAMARLAREEGMAIDVASAGELEVALRAGSIPSTWWSMAATSPWPSCRRPWPPGWVAS